MKTTATATFIQYFDMCVCCMQCVCFIVVVSVFSAAFLQIGTIDP